MNICFFKGNICSDIKQLETKSGTEMARFSVAIKRNRKTGGVYKSDFIQFVAFGSVAGFLLRYLKKGEPVLITAECQINKYYSSKHQKDIWETTFIARSAEACIPLKFKRNNPYLDDLTDSGDTDETGGVLEAMDSIEGDEPIALGEDQSLPFEL